MSPALMREVPANQMVQWEFVVAAGSVQFSAGFGNPEEQEVLEAELGAGGSVRNNSGMDMKFCLVFHNSGGSSTAQVCYRLRSFL